MADILKLATSVTYTDPDLNKTVRFLDEATTHDVISYYNGEANIIGNTTDRTLLSNVNMCVLFSDKPISVKVKDTTSTEMTNMKAFVYDGDTTDIFVSNLGVDAAKVKFIAAKY